MSDGNFNFPTAPYVSGARPSRAAFSLRIHELKDWPPLADYLAGQEKQYVARVLHACQGDKARAAKTLGVDASRIG